ncbi:MAG: protein kinase [Acaryochloris sp. RU_4_1]|nr:protein kinase [Acaryochloris sp. RU_4_1]NJR54931.1 protein kinase [Acaryochloris sp. CRU_2_0]
MIEQVIAYRYRLLETLNQGSFGTTYLAEDTYSPDHPKCIIKQLKPDSNDPKFLQIARRLFEQEASILGSLGNHPRIPKLLSYFESEQDFFLIQEFIDGISISQELGADKRWPELKIKAFLHECLEIVQFVHGLGVIHRDIKPDNLIRRLSDQSIFLLDFGAVKQISRGQNQVMETTIAVGTPGYMPDEQIRGRPHVSSDIYALGIIGIYGLTGMKPVTFERSEEDEILWQDRAEVSPELAAILSKMVRRDYRQRYLSVAEVLTDLQQLPPQSARHIYTNTDTISSQYQTEPRSVLAIPKSIVNDREQSSPTQRSERALPHYSDPSQPNGSWVRDSCEQTVEIPSPQEHGVPRTSVIPPEKGTAPVYQVSHSRLPWLRRLTALKVMLPTTILLASAGVGSFFLLGSTEGDRRIEQMNQLYGQQKYADCIEVGEDAISAQATFEQRVQNSLAKCYLRQGQGLAEQAKWGEAVQIIAKVSDQSPFHWQAKQQLDQWSARLLEEAKRDYEVKGKLKQALAQVDQIPQISVVKGQADALTQQWQQTHKVNQQKIAAAKKALQAGQAEVAIATAQQIKTPEYWKKIADQVQKDAEIAIANRPTPEPIWEPTVDTPTAAIEDIDPPVYQPPEPSSPSYEPPASSTPVYQPPPSEPQKDVVNICPGPLCTE